MLAGSLSPVEENLSLFGRTENTYHMPCWIITCSESMHHVVQDILKCCPVVRGVRRDFLLGALHVHGSDMVAVFNKISSLTLDNVQ